MQVLKGKVSILFLLVLFLLFSSYQKKDDQQIFPIFKIKNIKFENNINLEENIKNQIIELLKNKSLINVNKKNLVSIIENSQWVQSFIIKKHYPRSITLQIVEYKPIAIYKIKNQSFFINDNYKITEKLFNGKEDIYIKVSGKYIDTNFKYIYSNLNNFKMLNNVATIDLLNLERADLYLKNNIQVKLGRYSLEKQFKILNTIKKKYNNLQFIDLRNEDRAIIK
tara:strand:+ start:850 stop:1521 length:672 start_codon:yes stop_codon:yes gene_type:complete